MRHGSQFDPPNRFESVRHAYRCPLCYFHQEHALAHQREIINADFG